jgi:capsular polysaccharide biosynthesis protein
VLDLNTIDNNLKTLEIKIQLPPSKQYRKFAKSAKIMEEVITALVKEICIKLRNTHE